MRIKKIELIGFKSFKDRTVIQFDAGITGIVGPNGCGKSNIVDALVWVMGEMSAKDLRGSTMTDVIFAGAESYAPSGMAEVSLTLENDGGPFPVKYLKHSEIMVTRRLHRNGESEYMINKEPARLKDVQEIFMDTGAGSKGFSIIQQGMIGKIITAKPEDRKTLIEEAAGITKFKARKKESQRKLQSTEQNLLRLQDIVGELKRQIDSLQRQAQKAERYRNLKTQIEEIDLWLASRQFSELRESATQCQESFQSAQSLEVQGEAQLGELQSRLEVLKLQVLEAEKSVEELQTEQFDLQSSVQKKELSMQSLKFEIEQARSKEEMTGNLLGEKQARLEILTRELATVSTSRADLEIQSRSVQKQFEERKAAFSEVQSRVQFIDERLTQTRRELFAFGQSESQLDAKLQVLQSQITDLGERLLAEKEIEVELLTKKEEFQARLTRLQADFEKERQLQFDLSADVESFEANRKALEEQIQVKRSEVADFKDRLNEVASRLYGLEDLARNFEGFEAGVKSVMLWQKARSQEITADGSVHFRPVSEVVEIGADYEVAMEAALGMKLQMLLTEKPDVAVDAVQYLKTGHGRASFGIGAIANLNDEASRNQLRQSQSAQIVSWLADEVRCEEKFRPQIEQLLGDVVVVHQLMDAIELRAKHPTLSFVTLDGDSLTREGVLTGGAREGAESGVLKRKREIKELSMQKDEWAGKVALAQAALKKAEEQLAGVILDFETARKKKLEQEVRVTEIRKDLERAEQELANAGYAIERHSREMNRLNEQSSALSDKATELDESLVEVREKKYLLQSESEQLEAEFTSKKVGFEGFSNEVTDLQIQSAQKLSEFESAKKSEERLLIETEQLKRDLDRMMDESQRTGVVLSEGTLRLEQEKRDFENAVISLERCRENLSVQKNTFEVLHSEEMEIAAQLTGLQRAANERQHLMNEAQLKFEQAKMKEQYLIDQVREKYQLNLPDIFEQRLAMEGIPSEKEMELKDLREKLSRIGEVNLSAIGEYEETSKRYEFLTAQQEDLNEAKEQLKKVIDRINRICSKRFKETFDLVNERFTRVFPVLFGGGEARLEIFEDVEKQEMGIDIIAKPPGKKMQNISLLSGGEKALTAVALVFSIFLVKPSPYCLLDEVDAPLDDANVYRFNDLVREMAKRSQIIVVTHNKHTMEIAAKLYGVTMQERGVSTMVSVNLADYRG